MEKNMIKNETERGLIRGRIWIIPKIVVLASL